MSLLPPCCSLQGHSSWQRPSQGSEPFVALPSLGDNGSSLLAQNSAQAPVAVLKLTLAFVCNLFDKVSPERPHVRVPLLSYWDLDVIRG